MLQNKLLFDFYYNNQAVRKTKIYIKEIMNSITFKYYRIANKSQVIINIINNINQMEDFSIFPMFGTLLCLYRDGEISKADDFDFAFVGDQNLASKIIKAFEFNDFTLHSFSIVNHKLVEISFKFKGVKVDIFILSKKNNYIEHLCPDFRKSTAFNTSFNGFLMTKYSRYFRVSYNEFELIKDDATGLLFPDKCEHIFEMHYGLDWKTPKMKNCIDYNNYKFIRGESVIVYSSPEKIEREINFMINQMK